MPNGSKAKKKTVDEMFAAFEDLVFKSMDPDIPIPQRQALSNRSQELRMQWIELEAARFNTDGEVYKKNLARVDAAVADLREAIASIDDAVRIADKAGKLFAAVDKLLKVAVAFV